MSCEVCRIVEENYDKFYEIYRKLELNESYYIEDPFDREYDTPGGYSYHDAIKFTRREWYDTNPDKWKNRMVRIYDVENYIKKNIKTDKRNMSKEEQHTLKVLGQLAKKYKSYIDEAEEEKVEGLEVKVQHMMCREGSRTFEDSYSDCHDPFLVVIKEPNTIYSKHDLHLNHNGDVDKDNIQFMRKFVE